VINLLGVINELLLLLLLLLFRGYNIMNYFIVKIKLLLKLLFCNLLLILLFY